MGLLDYLRKEEKKAVNEPVIESAEQEAEFFSLEPLPEHPKDAILIGVDNDEYNRIVLYCSLQLGNLNMNLVPLLYALNILSRYNVYRFGQFGRLTLDLKDAIRKELEHRNISPAMLDVLMTQDSRFKHSAQSEGSPDKKWWPFITLEKNEERKVDGCPYYLTLDTGKMKPYFEMWVSGKALQKYKLQKKIIGLMNEFFEGHVSPGLMHKYFFAFDSDMKNVIMKGGVHRLGHEYSDVLSDD